MTEETKELPKGWRWVKLGEVCKQDRQIIESRNNHSRLPYLSLEDVESDTGRILKTTTAAVEDEGLSTTFVFDQRHVLYGKLRPYLNKVALPNFAGRCTTEMIPLLPNEFICRDYFCWILRRAETVQEAMRENTGSRMPRANMKALFQIRFPLPPLSKQKRIVEILNKQMTAVGQARKVAEEQLADAKALHATYLHQIFPQSGQELPKGWRRVKLGEVCKFLTGGTPSKSDPANFGGDIKWLVSGDIHQGEITDCVGRITIQGMKNSNAGLLPTDCVMIALNGQGKTRGKVALLCVEATCNQSLVAIIPRDINVLLPRFLLHQLQMRYQELRNLTGDSHRSGLSMGILDRFEVILAPIEEQRRIAVVLKEQMVAAEKTITVLEEQLNEINALPSALLRQAFNGEI